MVTQNPQTTYEDPIVWKKPHVPPIETITSTTKKKKKMNQEKEYLSWNNGDWNSKGVRIRLGYSE